MNANMTIDQFFSKCGSFLEHRIIGSIVHFHYTHGFSKYDGKRWTFVIDYPI